MKRASLPQREKRYRAAIVGCGRAGCFLDEGRQGIWTHAGAYVASPHTELVALADTNPATLQRAADRWRVPRTYATLEAMLNHEAIDLLSVCTPSDAHAGAVRAAAAAGVRAVWCEKPMTVTLREAEELLGLGRVLLIAVNHIRRWDQPYEIARRLVTEGRLGRLITVSAHYTHGVANVGSHLFDALRFLLGEARWVWAAADDARDADPTLSGLIGWADGVCCHVMGCSRDVLLFEIDLIGTEARLRIGGNGSRVDLWTAAPSSRYPGYREMAGPTTVWEGEDGQRMLSAVEDIAQCLDHGGSPRCTAADGFRAVELIAAFLRSSATGQRVELPLSVEDQALAIPVR